MKFTTTQQDFSKAIAVASKALAKRPIHPVMEYFLVESDGAIISSNFQTFIEQKFEVQQARQGSVLIKAKMLMDLIKKLPKGELSLEVIEGNVSVASKGNYYKLESWKEVEDFPEISSFDLGVESKITVPAKDFLEGIRRTAYAASTNECHQVLTGICVTSEKFLEFAATDGRRLVMANFDKTESCKFKAVIPATVLVEVEKILRKTKDQSMELTINSGMCQIVCGDFNIKTRLLEGQYPNLDKLIPVNFDRIVTCDRALLLESLKRLSLYAPKPKERHSYRNVIDFQIAKNSITASILFNESEESIKEEISVSLAGENIEIRFNIFYLMDCLDNLSASLASIHIGNEISPVIITSDIAKVKALMMPVQKRK